MHGYVHLIFIKLNEVVSIFRRSSCSFGRILVLAKLDGWRIFVEFIVLCDMIRLRWMNDTTRRHLLVAVSIKLSRQSKDFRKRQNGFFSAGLAYIILSLVPEAEYNCLCRFCSKKNVSWLWLYLSSFLSFLPTILQHGVFKTGRSFTMFSLQTVFARMVYIFRSYGPAMSFLLPSALQPSVFTRLIYKVSNYCDLLNQYEKLHFAGLG